MVYYDNESGFITVITGPMYSEKSGELIDRCLKPQLYGKKTFIAYKPDVDSRWDKDKIMSRVGKWIPAKVIPCNITEDVIDSILLESKNHDIVAFDEAQFFDSNIIPLVKELAYNRKHVIIDCLNLNFKGEVFGYVGGLLAMADEIVKLFAYCACCGSPMASFSQMLIDGEPAKDAPIITIEGNTQEITYEPRCRKCYIPPEKI